MSYIGSLAIHEPEKAKAEIVEAVDRSRGRLISAALELGVERRHLQRLCWVLGLWPEVDEIRAKWAKLLADPASLILASQPGLTQRAS